MANVKELNINSTTYDIVGKAVVDQNNATPLKMWSGTKAQYDLLTPDANTIYNITDDETQVDFAHTDADNFTATGKSTLASYGMPSTTYNDLTLGASGATYTAPANGYFYLWKNAGNPGFNPFMCLTNATANMATEHRPGANGDGLAIRLYIPAKKGDTVVADYDAIGAVIFFRFIYAEGDV